MWMRLSVLTITLALFVVPSAGRTTDDRSCGMYPKEVLERGGGWNGCELRDMGAKALWKRESNEDTAVLRFTFTEGHDSFFRAVTVTQSSNGTAKLLLLAQDRKRGSEPESWSRRRNLSSAEVAELERLATESGTWDFDYGSWDGDDLYVHCQLLEMERAATTGYRYSSVNLSCNRPAKLMPLVNEVVRLARLKWAATGLVR